VLAGVVGRRLDADVGAAERFLVVETGVDPVTYRFSGGRSAY
jgi:hypothetical protein